MHEPVPQPPAEDPVPQPPPDTAAVTYEWLSARVADNDALEDQIDQNSTLTGVEFEWQRTEWWRQRLELAEKALDVARQHPKKGKALFEAMVLSENLADKKFIVRFMADYMSIEGQDQKGAENFATLLLGPSDAGKEAEFALKEAINNGKLTAHQVAHIAFVVAHLARKDIGRLKASRTPSQ